jgi:hypothetical protein
MPSFRPIIPNLADFLGSLDAIARSSPSLQLDLDVDPGREIELA